MNVAQRLTSIALISLFLFSSVLTTAWGDAPTAASSIAPQPETPLNEPRTATELPTKRKLPTAQPVEVKRQESDRQIQTRLNRIAKSQDVFQKVKVTAVEGIVTLQGEVEEESYAKSFAALSEKVEGVIGVVDQLKITNLKKTGLRLAQSEVTNLIQKFFKFLPYLASCMVIMLITFLLGMGIFRFSRMILLKRLPTRPMLAQGLAKTITAPVFIFGIYLILQVGGATGLAATVVGGTGMLGIVLGLAGKNILENVLSSFMLTLRNPFKVGDQVIIGTEAGVVHSMDSRCTMLLTHEGVFTQIPNSLVLASVIKNISAHPTNRIEFTLSVDAENDLPNLPEVFHRTLELCAQLILTTPKPKWMVTDLSGANATITCSFWVDTQKVNSTQVKSNLLQAMRYFIDEAKAQSATAETQQKLLRRKQALDSSVKVADHSWSEKKILEKQNRQVQVPANGPPPHEPPSNHA